MPDAPTRLVRLLRPPDATGVGLLALTSRGKTAFYVFREVPCDIGGRGFAMHRLGLGAVYNVRVGRPDECSCECMGFLRHGQCKHLQGMLALVGHGLV
jgi:hypothetical protein